MLLKCLDFKIKKKEKLLVKLKDHYIREVGCFRKLVSWCDFKILSPKLKRSNDYKLRNIRDTHARKLQILRVALQGEEIKANGVFFFFF